MKSINERLSTQLGGGSKKPEAEPEPAEPGAAGASAPVSVSAPVTVTESLLEPGPKVKEETEAKDKDGEKKQTKYLLLQPSSPKETNGNEEVHLSLPSKAERTDRLKPTQQGKEEVPLSVPAVDPAKAKVEAPVVTVVEAALDADYATNNYWRETPKMVIEEFDI